MIFRRQVAASDGSGNVTATFGNRFPEALPGSLLVAAVFCRGDVGNDPTPSFDAGWTIRVLRNTEIANSSFRRGLAVATKIADGSETSVTVNYNAQASNDIRVELLEFTGGTFTFLDADSNDNGTTSNAETIGTGTADAGAAIDVLAIGVMGGRVGASAPRLQGTASWTNDLTDIFDSFVNTNNTRAISTAWARHSSGGTHSSTATVSPTGGNANTGLSAAILLFSVTPDADPDPDAVVRFGGGALPAGWSQTIPAGTGSDNTPELYSRLLVDAGESLSPIAPGVSAPQGPQLHRPVSGAFDFAVSLAVSAMVATQQTVDLHALGTGDTGARITAASGGVTSAAPTWSGFHRWDVGEDAVAVTQPHPAPLRGPASWMRMAWDGADTFAVWASHTGRTGEWAQVAQWTSAVVPTSFGVHLGTGTPDTDGRELRVSAVVDLLTRGSDDATIAWPENGTQVIESIDFTGQVALPAWLTEDTGPSASVVVEDDVAKMIVDMDVDGSYAWLLGPQNLPRDHGLLVSYTLPTGSTVTNAFFVPVVRTMLPPTDLPASQILPDKYRPGTGLLSETSASSLAAGQHLRMLTAHPAPPTETFSGAREFFGFSFLTDDTQGAINHFTSGRMWIRMEALGSSWRARWWRHGNTEPTTWHYTGSDFTQIDGRGMALVWAHNDGTTGATDATAQVHSVEVYAVESPADLVLSAQPGAVGPSGATVDLTLGVALQAQPGATSIAGAVATHAVGDPLLVDTAPGAASPSGSSAALTGVSHIPPGVGTYRIAKILGECARVALVDTEAGEPDRVCVIVPGDIADDACDCGLLAVTVPRIYPSRSFPVEAADDAQQGPCGVPYLAFEVLLSVMRCAPNPDHDGTPPSCADLDVAARIWHEDAHIVRQAVACCLKDMEETNQIAAFVVRGTEARGPSGGCVGSDLRVTVGIPHCMCPDGGL